MKFRDVEPTKKTKKCKRCKGSGKLIVTATRDKIPCGTCEGKGHVKRNAIVRWYISLGDGA